MAQPVVFTTLRPGDLLADKYRIVRVLGEGGMGVVYAAHHLLLDQEVAIKVLRPEMAQEPQAVARFLNEARAASRIESEHVARVLDVGSLPSGAPFMAIELLEGCDLASYLAAHGPLDARAAVDFVMQALDALAHAHMLGIVHRDLKPANLFLVLRKNGTTTVKLLDFGISKLIQPDTASVQVTSTKAILGSPAYMSPEQLRESRDVDPRADIWSIGVILYEVLTGRLPFQSDTVGGMFAAVLEETPAALRVHREDLHPALDEVVLRCLAKKRERRWASVADLATALAPFGTADALHSSDRLLRTMPASSTTIVDDALELRRTARIESSPPDGPPIVRSLPIPTTSTGPGGLAAASVQVPAYTPRSRRLVPVAIALGALVLGTGVVVWLAAHRAPSHPDRTFASASAPPSATELVEPAGPESTAKPPTTSTEPTAARPTNSPAMPTVAPTPTLRPTAPRASASVKPHPSSTASAGPGILDRY